MHDWFDNCQRERCRKLPTAGSNPANICANDVEEEYYGLPQKYLSGANPTIFEFTATKPVL
jgi:hypothetical protein